MVSHLIATSQAPSTSTNKNGFSSAVKNGPSDVVGAGLGLTCLLLVPELQVRIRKPVEVPPSPPAEGADSDAAAEPAEQEELLDSGAVVEQSDWL